MESYTKYLPLSGEDRMWGASVLHVGCGTIKPSAVYPAPDRHPAPYIFNWHQGLLLDEYQLIYITHGKGSFQSDSVSLTPVTAGTVLLLFPGEWHSYIPDREVGWCEYWVGFDGTMVDELMKKGIFDRNQPVLQIGMQSQMIYAFENIMEHTKYEYTGYQALVSGAVIYLLGMLQMVIRQQRLKYEGLHDEIITKTKVLLRESIFEQISMESITDHLDISYATLRKLFKKYTGLSMKQYSIQLKIDYAKNMLTYSDKNIKEIAYELHFDSTQHFSKQFKEKVGIPPREYEKILHNKKVS